MMGFKFYYRFYVNFINFRSMLGQCVLCFVDYKLDVYRVLSNEDQV